MTQTDPAPLVLDGTAVEKLLLQLDDQAEITALFRALGQGNAVQPAQYVTDFPGGGGDFITYCWAR